LGLPCLGAPYVPPCPDRIVRPFSAIDGGRVAFGHRKILPFIPEIVATEILAAVAGESGNENGGVTWSERGVALVALPWAAYQRARSNQHGFIGLPVHVLLFVLWSHLISTGMWGLSARSRRRVQSLSKQYRYETIEALKSYLLMCGILTP
jgi:hypothetical protein